MIILSAAVPTQCAFQPTSADHWSLKPNRRVDAHSKHMLHKTRVIDMPVSSKMQDSVPLPEVVEVFGTQPKITQPNTGQKNNLFIESQRNHFLKATRTQNLCPFFTSLPELIKHRTHENTEQSTYWMKTTEKRSF